MKFKNENKKRINSSHKNQFLIACSKTLHHVCSINLNLIQSYVLIQRKIHYKTFIWKEKSVMKKTYLRQDVLLITRTTSCSSFTPLPTDALVFANHPQRKRINKQNSRFESEHQISMKACFFAK